MTDELRATYPDVRPSVRPSVRPTVCPSDRPGSDGSSGRATQAIDLRISLQLLSRHPPRVYIWYGMVWPCAQELEMNNHSPVCLLYNALCNEWLSDRFGRNKAAEPNFLLIVYVTLAKTVRRQGYWGWRLGWVGVGVGVGVRTGSVMY